MKRWSLLILLSLCLSCSTTELDLEELLESEEFEHELPEVIDEMNEREVMTLASFLEPEYQWVVSMQRESGLMESAEYSGHVSLYDNALAALFFVHTGEYERAEAIFDHFQQQFPQEFPQQGGGFFQARELDGSEGRRTWMGDNAWLLIALQQYEQRTGATLYADLAEALENWLRGLQLEDGSLSGGFEEDGTPIPPVTEGMLTAFQAVPGFDEFHEKLLAHLLEARYEAATHSFTTLSDDARYAYALDLHSLGALILEEVSGPMVQAAARFRTTQVHSQNGKSISGYCFDTDLDVVWLEGSAQLALAYRLADDEAAAKAVLEELRRATIPSVQTHGTAGIPYTTNFGSTFGAAELWDHADLTPALSSTIWHLFAETGINPMRDLQKEIPEGQYPWND